MGETVPPAEEPKDDGFPMSGYCYIDEAGYRVEVVPTEVVRAMNEALNNPPPVDEEKAQRLARMLKRYRDISPGLRVVRHRLGVHGEIIPEE